MATRLAQIEETRNAILAAVRELGGKPSPNELIEHVVDRGTPEDAVRVVLWYLIDQKELSLTHDWRIMLSDVGTSHERELAMAS